MSVLRKYEAMIILTEEFNDMLNLSQIGRRHWNKSYYIFLITLLKNPTTKQQILLSTKTVGGN